MHDVISRVEPADSPLLMAAFIVLSLILFVSGIGFVAGVFIGVSTTVLGVALALAFASLGGMVLCYHRLFHPHRIVVEYDEELW